ncbi:hypothetical protein CFOL_v3_34135 [Cephalotus follicularis]|uniref:Uncharacterized protein n=1 Tax=Cephalotus follicularis TaxID=3775 RepID=A0A1Q3DE74_CEPFO|nr:hypothetical protein CFOL_v3_34135 [Cephalotus follicularis]
MDWLEYKLVGNKDNTQWWRLQFLATLWTLRKTRNEWSFDGLHKEKIEVQNIINGDTDCLLFAFADQDSNNKREPQMVSWSRPPNYFYKLNTDCSSRRNLGPSGARGLFIMRREIGSHDSHVSL